MQVDYLWYIATTILLFLYTLNIFEYVSVVFKYASNNFVRNVLFSALNSIVISISLFLNLPWQILIGITCILLFLEFFHLNKRHIKQVLMAYTVFMFHIASVFYTCIITIAFLGDTTISSIVGTNTHLSQAFAFSLVALIILLIVVTKLLPNEPVIRASVEKKHSLTVSIIATVFSTFTCIDMSMQSNSVLSDNVYIFSLLTMLFYLIVFYIIFVFFLHFVTLSELKRHSDHIQGEYTHIVKERNEYKNKVNIDTLTGLYNRRYLYQILNKYHSSQNKDFALLFIDMNALKYVNDNFGHNTGDKYIKLVANCIDDSVREDDFCARIGGDEFIVVLNNIFSEEDVNVIKNRIDSKLDFVRCKEAFPMSISIGSVVVDERLKTHSIEEIIHIADIDMIEHKKAHYAEVNGK